MFVERIFVFVQHYVLFHFVAYVIILPSLPRLPFSGIYYNTETTQEMRGVLIITLTHYVRSFPTNDDTCAFLTDFLSPKPVSKRRYRVLTLRMEEKASRYGG
jgi:hypothetical protein